MNEVYSRVGALLKAERQRRGLDLLDIANELKISVTSLSHVEDGSASRLPAELYFSLFAKSYSAQLGIDYERTVQAIKEEIGYQEPVVPAAGTEEVGSESPERKGNIWVAVGVIALVAIVAALGWQYLSADSPAEMETIGQDSAAVSERPDADSMLLGGSMMPFDSLAGLTLSLMARVESFGTVIADGKTVLSGEMEIGKDYPFVAHEKLIVTLGTPEAVDIRINGRKAELGESRTKRVTNVEITPATAQSFLVRSAGDSLVLAVPKNAADSSAQKHQPQTTQQAGQ